MWFARQPVDMSRFGTLCVVLALVLAACSQSGSNSGDEGLASVVESGAADGETDGETKVTTSDNNEPEIALPDFESTGELEQALISYGECVEESFPIAMRFRVDPFVGLYTEIGSQREEEGDLVDQVDATCNRRLDLDRRISLYMVENPLSPADESKLVDEFVSCADTVSATAADAVSTANLDSLDSVAKFIIDLVPEAGELSTDDLFSLGDCEQSISGPRRVFDDGHPWFTTGED